MPRKFAKVSKKGNKFVTPFTLELYDDVMRSVEKKSKKEEKKVTSYAELEKAYEAIKNKISPKRAFKITCSKDKNLLFIAFTEKPTKAVYKACKYFQNSNHPEFMGRSVTSEMMRKLRTCRVPELDKYKDSEKVPIPALMQILGIKFSCGRCKKYHFSYSDYERKLCHIIEGETVLNPFTDGLVFCSNCIKYFI